jgi:uncharacterized protein (TIGR02265 family)
MAEVKAGARIKGGVLLSRLRFLRDRGGEALVGQVLGRLSADDRSVLQGFLLPTSWYPLDLNLRLDQAIADGVSPQAPDEVFREMGRVSAQANLTAGAQAAFVRPNDPHGLLSQAPTIYRHYYAVGYREYERLTERSARIRTYNAESVTATDCLTIAGWHQRAVELCGGKSVKVVEEKCRAKGDDHCAYRIEWA